MKKKSQVWVIDLIVGLFIFLAGALLFFRYANANDSDTSIDGVYSQAKTISDYLISEGYPTDWNQTNVIRLGLTTGDHVLDIDKLKEFTNMTKTDYDNVKTTLVSKGDFVIYFENKNGELLNLSEQFIGNPYYNSTNIDNANPDVMVKVFRYLVYKRGGKGSAEIIKMVMIYWV